MVNGHHAASTRKQISSSSAKWSTGTTTPRLNSSAKQSKQTEPPTPTCKLNSAEFEYNPDEAILYLVSSIIADNKAKRKAYHSSVSTVYGPWIRSSNGISSISLQSLSMGRPRFAKSPDLNYWWFFTKFSRILFTFEKFWTLLWCYSRFCVRIFHSASLLTGDTRCTLQCYTTVNLYKFYSIF